MTMDIRSHSTMIIAMAIAVVITAGLYGTSETVIDSEERPDGYYLKSMSYEDLHCTYYIGYPFLSEKEFLNPREHASDISPIGTVPIVILAGIILIILKGQGQG